MRLLATMTALSIAIAVLSGCSKRMDEMGLSFSGSTTAEQVHLLIDETWVDAAGKRQIDQEIFDSVFDIIDDAEAFILIDFFGFKRCFDSVCYFCFFLYIGSN